MITLQIIPYKKHNHDIVLFHSDSYRNNSPVREQIRCRFLVMFSQIDGEFTFENHSQAHCLLGFICWSDLKNGIVCTFQFSKTMGLYLITDTFLNDSAFSNPILYKEPKFKMPEYNHDVVF